MPIENLYHILLSDKPSVLLKNNEEELFSLIPELEICKGFKQNNDWHIYDVYEHILHVVDNTSSNLVLRLAALFHDVGKPNSYTIDEMGVGHFYGHFEESQKIFDKFAIKHNIDKDLKDIVSSLIFYHDINVLKISDDILTLMIKKLGFNGIEQLFELKRADLLAQNKKYHYILNDYDKQMSLLISKY